MASGLDTEAIVSQLMALEQNKVTAVQRRQIGVQQHKDDLSAIKTKLDALKTAAAALERHRDLEADADRRRRRTPTKIDVTLLGGAGIGGHSIQVNKLASSAQHGFTYAPSATAGTLTLSLRRRSDAADGSQGHDRRRGQRDRRRRCDRDQRQRGLAGLRRGDQGERGAERIVLSARKTGEGSNFTVDTSAMGAGSSLTEVPAYERVGTRPQRVLHARRRGARRASPSPTSSRTPSPASGYAQGRHARPGVGHHDAGRDRQGRRGQEGHGARRRLQRGRHRPRAPSSTEKSDPKATTTADLQKGKLFGDSGLTSMLCQLKSQMTQAVTGLGLTGLADLGIDVPKTTGGASSEDAKAGKLDDRHREAHQGARRRLHQGPRPVRRQGRHEGHLRPGRRLRRHPDRHQRRAHRPHDVRRLGASRTSRPRSPSCNERMKTTEARLKAQFAAMETALNNSQTQQAWLTSQISSLPTLGWASRARLSQADQLSDPLPPSEPGALVGYLRW